MSSAVELEFVAAIEALTGPSRKELAATSRRTIEVKEFAKQVLELCRLENKLWLAIVNS